MGLKVLEMRPLKLSKSELNVTVTRTFQILEVTFCKSDLNCHTFNERRLFGDGRPWTREVTMRHVRMRGSRGAI